MYKKVPLLNIYLFIKLLPITKASNPEFRKVLIVSSGVQTMGSPITLKLAFYTGHGVLF